MHSIPCQNDFHTGNRGPIRITTQILRHLGRYCVWIVYWVESTTNWSKTRTAAVHPTARRRPGQVTPKIKLWRLKEDNLRIQFREKQLGERRLLESVQELWEETGFVILRAWQEVLGMSTGRRPTGDKVT